MQSPPPFGYQQIVTELIRGVLDVVADKPGLSPERKAAAQQTVVCSVMSYNPRDPLEVMVAGQCIVYDAILRDGARDMLRGQAELIKIQARPGVLAAGKMFLETTKMVLRMQGRPADSLAFARPAEVPAPVKEVPVAEPEPEDTLTAVSHPEATEATGSSDRAGAPAGPNMSAGPRGTIDQTVPNGRISRTGKRFAIRRPAPPERFVRPRN